MCFNPLHCGAVVASFDRPPRRTAGGGQVSIPFIAGQWSLRAARASADVAEARFQSPSLRGSGRFVPKGEPDGGFALGFQSPSLRGSGRFSNTATSAP